MEAFERLFGTLRQSACKITPKYAAIKGSDPLSEPFDIETTEKTTPLYIVRGSYVHSTRGRLLGTISVLFIIVILVPFAWYFGHYGHHIPEVEIDKPLLDCGDSIEEAQAKGCIFDVLDYNWVPAECYDEETAVEFREWLNQTDIEFGPFPFYEEMAARHHVHGETKLSERIGGDDGVSTYATQQEHRAHCVFTMRRYVRMQKHPEKRRVPLTTGHLEHCLKEVIEALKGPAAWEKGHLGSSFGVGFSTC